MPPMPRIAFFDHRVQQPYGAQINLMLLGEECQRAGIEVVFHPAQGRPFHRLLERNGLPTAPVEIPNEQVRRVARTPGQPGATRWIRRADPRGLVRLAVGAWSRHAAITRERPDFVIANGVRPMLMIWITGVRRRPRVILWAQNDIPLGFTATIAGALAWRIALISPRAIETFTPRTRTLLRRRFRALPSGRDFSAFEPPHERPARSTIRIVTVSSIDARKRLDLLLDAVAATGLPHLDVAVVGGTVGSASERYATQLRQQARRLDVRTEFVGWHDDVAPHLRNADIFVLASANEGLPGALLEAMASGLPCITTRAGAAGDLVEAADAGIAVAVDDLPALTEAIRTLADDPDGRHRLGRNGADHVRRHYDLAAMLRALLDILDDAPPR